MRHLIQKTLLLLLTAALLCVCMLPAAGADYYFYDVDNGGTFTPAISYVVEHELFNGRSTGYFAPELSMNRAMFYVVLSRMAGVAVSNETGTNLSDVPAEKWYTGAVVWAISSGIADCRDSSSFGVSDEITRWEICLAFARYDRLMGTNILDPGASTTFLDLGQLDAEARSAIAACHAAGIVNGRDDGRFDPMSNASRAHVAKMIANFHMLLNPADGHIPEASSTAWNDVTGWTGLLHMDFPLSFLDEITYDHILWLNERILRENTPAATSQFGETLDGNPKHLTNYGKLGLHDCIHTTTILFNSKNGVDAGTELSGLQEYYGYALQVKGVSKQDRWHQQAADTGKGTWQCTWWAWGRAAQYLELAHGLDLASVCSGKTTLGNGGDYYNSLRPYFLSDQTPSANSIVSWRCGTYGHVGYVEAVDDNGIWVSMADSGHTWRGITYIVKTESATNPYPLNWYAYERFNGFNHLDFAADGEPIS